MVPKVFEPLKFYCLPLGHSKELRRLGDCDLINIYLKLIGDYIYETWLAIFLGQVKVLISYQDWMTLALFSRSQDDSKPEISSISLELVRRVSPNMQKT